MAVFRRHVLDFFDVVEQRRSIRKFMARQVEPEKIQQLLATVLRAPTARSARSCDFIVVERAALLAELAKSRPSGGAFVGEAPLAVVVCSDPAKATPWIEDAAIAASYLQLAAQALGLGSCWFHIRGKSFSDELSSHKYVANLLHVPENLQVVCIIAIGYAAEEKAPYQLSELPFEKVRFLR